MPAPIAITRQLNDEDILTAIHWACRKLYYSIDRAGMNQRAAAEALDDKIMGDLATVAVLSYAREQGVGAVAYDEVRINDFRKADPGWDIAFGTNAGLWASKTNDPRSPQNLITASVKSSRFPPQQENNIEETIRFYDFKILHQPGRDIGESITSDTEFQVYFSFRQSQLGNINVSRELIVSCLNSLQECGQVAARMQVRERFGTCYLTAWNYREAVVAHSKRLTDEGKEATWVSRHAGAERRMWKAPLRLGMNFTSIGELNK